MPRPSTGTRFSAYPIRYPFPGREPAYRRRAVSYLRIIYCITFFLIFLRIYIRRYFFLRIFYRAYLLMILCIGARTGELFLSFLIYFYTSFFIYCVFFTVCFLIRTYMATGPGIFPSFFRIPFRFLYFFFRILYCILLPFLSYLIPYVFFLRLPVSFLFCGLGMYSCRMDAVRYRGFNTGKIRMKDGRREER